MKQTVRVLISLFVLLSLVKSAILETQPDCASTPNTSIFPDPDNCYGFLVCLGGVLQSGNCPNNMWFNPITLGCDIGECETTTTTEVTTETEEITDTTTTDIITTTTETTTLVDTTIPSTTIELPSDIEDGIECPKTLITYLPSAIQCHRYYMCLYGVPYVMYCIIELHWNTNIDKCDYPYNADCYSRITTTTITTTSEPDSTELPKCLTTGVEFYPHPANCNFYISCVYGYQSIQHCPFYNYWDRDLKKCVVYDHYVPYC